jgi:hypothetical protein
MKNFRIFFIILATASFITSCEKDKSGPFLNESAAAPEITAPAGGTSYVFLEANEVKDTIDFTWTVPDYGFAAAVQYALEIDKSGNDFAGPITLANSARPKLNISVGDFNMKVLTLGGLPGELGNYEVRVTAKINDSVPKLISEVVPLKITPYEKLIIYPMLFAPGGHNGWNQADSASALYSVKSNDIYEGYLWFKDASTQFKLLKEPAWVQTSCIGDANSSGTSGTLVVGDWGNNISVDGGIGYYHINANLVEKTYSWMKTDWGIIGPAQPGGWNTDSNMTYDVATDLWKATLDLTAGEMKFRANDAWTLNYGDNGADRKLEENGANIAVPAAGNYTVTLDLSGAVYKYKLVKN